MTDTELAGLLYPDTSGRHASVASIITGVAVTDSDSGWVDVRLDGSTMAPLGGSSDEVAVRMQTTVSVSEGDTVVVTLSGPLGGARRAFVSGVQGGAPDGDLAGRVAALETAVDDLDDDVDTAQRTITSLGTRMTTAEGDIDDLEAASSSQASSITSLGTRMTTAEGDIDDLQSASSSQASSITSLGTRMTTAEGEIDDLQSASSSQASSITSLGTRMTTAEGEIDDLQEDMTQAQADIEELQQGGSLPALEARVTTAEGEIDDLQEDMAQAQTDIDTVEDTVSTHTTSISGLGTRISTLEGRYGYWDLGTFSSASQIKGTGLYKFSSIDGAVKSAWAGTNSGDYHAFCWDWSGNSTSGIQYGNVIATSPRTPTIWQIRFWNYTPYIRAL